MICPASLLTAAIWSFPPPPPLSKGRIPVSLSAHCSLFITANNQSRSSKKILCYFVLKMRLLCLKNVTSLSEKYVYAVGRANQRAEMLLGVALPVNVAALEGKQQLVGKYGQVEAEGGSRGAVGA